MPLAVGQEFAGYRILRVLGAGSMGTVYLAQHPRLPRHDAVKVLSAELTTDPGFRARFLREADIGASLSHPNIVGIHDRGEYHGQFWISMDYVEGTDAARLLHDHYPGGMPPGEVFPIIAGVASALDYAHRRGLLHRDVKPSNILLAEPDSESRRIFLSDFGIARRVDDTAGLTATNIAVGTVAYAAPEQLMGEPVDARADQYALACTAFHLLVGSPPYDFSSAAVVITKHVMGPPPPIGERRPELAPLDPVFARAMAKVPADRFDSCQDFTRELHARVAAAPSDMQHTQLARTVAAYALQRPPAPPQPAQAPPAKPPGTRVWRRPKILIPALVAIALLVGGGTFAAVKISQPGGEQPWPVATALPNNGPFTGMYTANFGPGTDYDGNPAENKPPVTETWAVRSTCGPTGCVANASRRSGDYVLSSAMVFDDVDGRWLAVGTGQYGCLGITSETWEVFDLQPRPDGTLSGEYRWAARNNCSGKRTVTFTRSGDVDVKSLPDPANLPPRVVSPAEALDGRYHQTRTYANGSKTTEFDWAVRTDCLRSGAGCMSYFHSPPNNARVLVFGDGNWVWSRDFDGKCDQGGGPMHVKASARYSLPQPPQNPITLLTAHGHQEQTGSCPINAEFDDKFVRTGN
ncbi:serine/threonine-protein kinase [Mycobacterium sp. Dal123C01]|uniref:serine/threonine-protein kinase n=1 Tax=Mycobacterium sp. Dal123C01 TaxID=3457577 RepID=UPI00403EBDEF